MRSIVVALLLLLSGPVLAAGFDHSVWDAMLKRHVQSPDNGMTTAVDYAGFAAERDSLQSYLAGLSAVEPQTFDTWPVDEQLAFLINAYNAWTVELILGAWPELESIKDLGSLFRSPWSRAFIPLLGKTRSLDDIEHGLIRESGRYREPRIHFAVNCASIGCPALRAEAYRADVLPAQLDEQTRVFLADRSRNRLSGTTLELSSIFKWYRKDFEKQWQGYARLEDFLADYAAALGLSPVDVRRLKAGEIRIRFLDYDWRLNAVDR